MYGTGYTLGVQEILVSMFEQAGGGISLLFWYFNQNAQNVFASLELENPTTNTTTLPHPTYSIHPSSNYYI